MAAMIICWIAVPTLMNAVPTITTGTDCAVHAVMFPMRELVKPARKKYRLPKASEREPIKTQSATSKSLADFEMVHTCDGPDNGNTNRNCATIQV